MLGAEDSKFWHDRKGASLSALRTCTAIARSEVVVVCSGENIRCRGSVCVGHGMKGISTIVSR
ncbi:YtoQ family protein [Paracoccus saliphilus]|uniref:YtoQ family protein n=1 Tax=Paracoccus saliphilus TaxID=405559 RepID=UPI003AF31979